MNNWLPYGYTSVHTSFETDQILFPTVTVVKDMDADPREVIEEKPPVMMHVALVQCNICAAILIVQNTTQHTNWHNMNGA